MCGMIAKLSCSSCAKYNIRVKYCSQSCQKADWSDHKDVCGVKNPKAVAHESVTAGGRAGGLAGGWASNLTKPGDRCTRCLGDCNDGVCQVPHPVIDQDMQGMCASREGRTENFHCRACNRMYAMETTHHSGRKHKSGPMYCYEGEHTKDPLAKGDTRRVQPLTVHIKECPRLQSKISAIPEDTVNLIITSPDAGYRDEGKWVFEKKLPNLRQLRLDGVKFSRLVLNPELTPELRKLRLVNLGHTCDIKVQCPKLKELVIHYLTPDEGGRDSEQINEILSYATKLERFDSYKLWVRKPLEFASNNLESIYIHRSDALEGLRFWAPNLKELKLQANYQLDCVEFLKYHPLKVSLPEGHTQPKLEVTIINCNLPPAVRRDIEAHPTAVIINNDAGGRDFGTGLGVEEHWAKMYAASQNLQEANPGMSDMEVQMRAITSMLQSQ